MVTLFIEYAAPGPENPLGDALVGVMVTLLMEWAPPAFAGINEMLLGDIDDAAGIDEPGPDAKSASMLSNSSNL
jgi:hypothetical protein